MKRTIIVFGSLLVCACAANATPTVTDVVAKQRYPWNGFVDITCKVTGINGTTNGLQFAVAAVMPDAVEARRVRKVRPVPQVHTNGYYRLVWDALAELGPVTYDNMVMRVTLVDYPHEKIQLWEGGPYWADTNIGAYRPEEYGYYFWWGDTVGYARRDGEWVASDRSLMKFSFDKSNTPTYAKNDRGLRSDGWIAAGFVLAPEHDAAHVHWGGDWRMPTKQELDDLLSKCDWTATTMYGVQGVLVKGRGTYASNSIFLPCAGYGSGTSLYNAGSYGYYWSSVPYSDNYDDYYAWSLHFYSSYHYTYSYYFRYRGQSVRPVQGFTN